MEENLEQKIKLTYETNADEVTADVGKLGDATERVTKDMPKQTEATKQVEAVTKSFKAQLREANEALKTNIQRYGETSKEAVTAAKRVAELKDQMQFAKDLTDNFNPDQKFKALGAATQIAATGTSAVVSGFALLGDESEETTKMLLKVQAAMAFSDAISGLSNLGDQWMVFKTTVTDGYKAIFAAKKREIVITEAQTVAERIKNAVILSNPYIAITAAIVAVTVVTVAWIKSSNDAAEAQRKVAAAVGETEARTIALKKSVEEYTDTMKDMADIEILKAKERGASDKELNELIRAQKRQTVNDAEQADKEAYANVLKAQANLSKAYKTGDEDLIKRAQESKKAAEDLMKQQSDARSNAVTDEIKTEIQLRIDANKKAEELMKERAAKLKAIREKEKAEREAAEKAAYDRQQAWLELQNNQEKAFLDELDAAKKAYSDRLKTEEQVKLDDEYERYAIQLEKANQYHWDAEALELEHMNRINDIKLEGVEKEREQQKAIDDARLAYKAEVTEAEINLADKAAGFLSAIAGKNKVLQKTAILAESGVAIGKMIIANNMANIGALATPQAIATSGASAAPVIAFNNIATGLGVGANLAATAKALQAVGAGGSGSSGGNTARGGATAPGSSSGSAAPQVNFQGSSENQIAEGFESRNRDLPPIKAYVVTHEITTGQQLDANAISANSLAGG